MIHVRIMGILRFLWYLVFAYILSGIQSVSGCITTEFMSGNTALKLTCPIASFTGSATWNLDGVQKTSCLANGFCSTVTMGVYSFTSDSSAIYAMINPFALAEVGKVWTCNHSPISCNTTVENAPTESRSIKETKNGESAGIGAGSQGVTTAITSTVSGVIHKFGHVVFTPPVARKWYFSQEYYFLGTVVFGIQFVIVAAVVQILSIIIAVCVLLGYAGQYDNYVTILLVLLIFVLPSLGVAIYWLIVALCCRGDKTRPETKSCLPSGKTVLLLIIVILPLAWFVLLVLIFKNHKDKHKDEGNGKPDKNKSEENGKLDVKDVKEAGNQEQDTTDIGIQNVWPSTPKGGQLPSLSNKEKRNDEGKDPAQKGNKKRKRNKQKNAVGNDESLQYTDNGTDQIVTLDEDQLIQMKRKLNDNIDDM